MTFRCLYDENDIIYRKSHTVTASFTITSIRCALFTGATAGGALTADFRKGRMKTALYYRSAGRRVHFDIFTELEFFTKIEFS